MPVDDKIDYRKNDVRQILNLTKLTPKLTNFTIKNKNSK